MCIQAHDSLISLEKMCIKATLRANLSNGNWILSFRYKFLHKGNLWNCFICGLFHFCCMIWLNWRTSGNHFYIASLKTKHSCSNFWKHTELRKTDFFFSVSLDPESHSDIHPTTLGPYVACCFLLSYIMKPDYFLWIVIQQLTWKMRDLKQSSQQTQMDSHQVSGRNAWSQLTRNEWQILLDWSLLQPKIILLASLHLFSCFDKLIFKWFYEKL